MGRLSLPIFSPIFCAISGRCIILRSVGMPPFWISSKISATSGSARSFSTAACISGLAMACCDASICSFMLGSFCSSSSSSCILAANCTQRDALCSAALRAPHGPCHQTCAPSATSSGTGAPLDRSRASPCGGGSPLGSRLRPAPLAALLAGRRARRGAQRPAVQAQGARACARRGSVRGAWCY